MSQNDSASSAITLEEALAELEGLKEQLSGSDLKVFTQNRELRQETTKLREEVTRLAEECVTQTFSIRTLEKAKANLEGVKAKLEASKAELEESKAKLESQVANLNARVAELEERVAELAEDLGVHRSQEIHLSQELERTISANAEEMSRVKSEFDDKLSTTRENLERAKAELEQELSGKLQAKAAEVENLERRVEQFKEEFLSQEVASPIVSLPPAVEQGKAFNLLRDKMEGLLGFPGKAMVEQVFRLCGADESTSDPAVLEEAFEALQDSASKLVRSPEQEQELADLLKSSWGELGLDGGEFGRTESPAKAPEEGSAAAQIQAEGQVEAGVQNEAPVEAPAEVQAEAPAESQGDAEAMAQPPEVESLPPAADEVEPTPEAEQAALPEAAAEVEPEAERENEAPSALVEPSLESAEEVTEEVIAEDDLSSQSESASVETELSFEGATEEDLPPVEAGSEATPEVLVDSLEELLAADPEPVESSPAPIAEAEPEQEPEPESVPESEPELAPAAIVETEVPAESASASENEPPQEAEEYEVASAALQSGDYDSAQASFERLHQMHPGNSGFLVGRISALVGLERYDQAYELGKGISPKSLGDSEELFLESFEAALVGRVEFSETLAARKFALLELIDFVEDPDRSQAYLDEIDEIGLRVPAEGRLSLLQAKARVEHDDVTEYLLLALNSLDDKPEIFELLRDNLSRYPELAPLSELTEKLLSSPRDEALEAEVAAKPLLGGEESLEELLAESDPGEEALVQVFLEHLLPRTGLKLELPSEAFEDLLSDSEPAAFVGALRQALRSVDYTLFFDEIEVLSYDGEEHFLLRSCPEPSPTLLFGPEVDDVPPEELRFLVLRELFSMQRQHSHLAHLASQLDDKLRYAFFEACLEIHKEAEFSISDDLSTQLEELKSLATPEGQDPEFKAKLDQAILALYQSTDSDSFMELYDFLYDGQLHKKWLDPLADSFAAKLTGIVVASFAIARDVLEVEDFEALEESGFSWLYQEENLTKYSDLRLRLQRLWSMPFKALFSEAEE